MRNGILVFFVFVLATAGFAYWYHNKPAPVYKPVRESATEQPSQTSVSPRAHYRTLVNAYLTEHSKFQDKFWLTGEVDHNNPMPHVERVAKWSNNLRQQMERFGSLNDLTKRIMQHFMDFRTTMAVGVGQGEASMDIMVGAKKDLQKDMEKIQQMLEVCAVPQNRWDMDRYPSPVFYFSSWRAVKVVAVEMPTLYQIALFYHELGHALRDRVDNAPSAHAPAKSDLWIEEEVEMHELESAILNQGTNGQFFDLYKKIRARTKNGDMNDVIKATTTEDLNEYDQLFEIEHAGPAMSSIYIAQFFLGLGFYTLDENHRNRTPKERLISKIGFYRFAFSM